MKFRFGSTGLSVKSVHLTVHCSGGKAIKIECQKVRHAIEDLRAVTEKVKLVSINIGYTNGEHKRANCDSLEKTLSWLNLNDTKE